MGHLVRAAALSAGMAGVLAGCGGGTTEPGTAPQPATPDFTVGLPTGWGGASSPSHIFQLGTDAGIVHGGRRSGSLRNASALGVVPAGAYATLVQGVRADNYRGKRVRLRGWLRTDAVQDGGAGLWLRIDGRGGGLTLDNMDGRRLTGTAAWRQVAVVLDVPRDADGLSFGALLAAAGQAWYDDLTLETVGQDVPTTAAYALTPPGDAFSTEQLKAAYAVAPLAPAGLDFEAGIAAARAAAPRR